MNGPGSPTTSVFIAYAQDSTAHKDAVRGLADLLRSCGIDAEIDQYAEEQPQDWYHRQHLLLPRRPVVVEER